MPEIFRPKLQSSSTTQVKSEWEKIVIPDDLDIKGVVSIYPDILNSYAVELQRVGEELNRTKKDLDKYRDNFRNQSNQNIEIIGIFSAILALLIIDVSVVKSAETFLSAILLIAGLTTSMVIFLALVNYFFHISGKKDNTLRWAFWIPIAILSGLIILGIYTYSKNVNIYKLPPIKVQNDNLGKNQNTNINQ